MAWACCGPVTRRAMAWGVTTSFSTTPVAAWRCLGLRSASAIFQASRSAGSKAAIRLSVISAAHQRRDRFQLAPQPLHLLVVHFFLFR